jgi:hypothetical protein
MGSSPLQTNSTEKTQENFDPARENPVVLKKFRVLYAQWYSIELLILNAITRLCI